MMIDGTIFSTISCSNVRWWETRASLLQGVCVRGKGILSEINLMDL